MFPLSIKNSLTAVIAIFFLVLFSCGSKPKKKEVVIKKDKNTHELALTGRNNLKGTLYVDTILDKKKRKKWRIQLSLTADSISPKKFVWYKDSLEDGLTKVLKQCMLVPFQRPKSANFEFAEDHFELVEAVPGSMIDTAACVINLKHEEKTAKLDYKKFGAWLHLDTSMKVVIDTLPFQEFIEEVALKMDAPLSDFLNKEPTETETVLDTLQEEPMIPRINVYKEMAAIAKLIPLGKKSTYTLAFSSVPVLQGFKNGKTSFVEVSLSDQKLWLFKNGCLILETDVVTGNKKTGHLTPKGNYSVRHKTKDRVLRGPDYAAFVRYWMPFYNGYGLHDADWRRSFGGTIWERSGSHGCVNMPVRNAPIVYANVKVGTTVIVR